MWGVTFRTGGVFKGNVGPDMPCGVIVGDDRLCPGTWQLFFFCTFDDPRGRNVVGLQVTGLQPEPEKGPVAALHPASPILLRARYQTICALPG